MGRRSLSECERELENHLPLVRATTRDITRKAHNTFREHLLLLQEKYLLEAAIRTGETEVRKAQGGYAATTLMLAALDINPDVEGRQLPRRQGNVSTIL